MTRYKTKLHPSEFSPEPERIRLGKERLLEIGFPAFVTDRINLHSLVATIAITVGLTVRQCFLARMTGSVILKAGQSIQEAIQSFNLWPANQT